MGNFFAELKRRHIYRVAAAYAVVAWVALQLVNNVAPLLRLPEWAGSFFLVLLLVGFPVALIFAWTLELKALVADETPAHAHHTRMDYVLAGALIAVIGIFLYQQFAPAPGAGTGGQATVAPAAPGPQPGGISIAVLPFANLSGDAAQEFFSDGMTEEIMTALAKVKDLRVVARTSAFEFKGQNPNIKAIGQALGTTYLIEGSVRKAGTRVRIAAQLVQADNGVNVWTESYDRELTDVFAIQEEIAQAIAGALRVPLGLAQGGRLVSDRTKDLESYDQYLRAKALVRARDGRKPLTDATALLEQVVARDPDFAPAWALLAQAYAVTPVSDVAAQRRTDVEALRRSVDASLPKAEAAARRAIQLDANLADGYVSLGRVDAVRGKLLLAEDLYLKALALDPNNPDVLHFYSEVLAEVGRLQESLAMSQRAQTLEPFVHVFIGNTIAALWLNGQTDAATAMLKLPNDSTYLAEMYAAMGRYREAADFVQANPAGAYPPGMVEEAARLLRTAPAPAASPQTLPRLGTLGFVYVYVGAPDRVLEYYEGTVEAGYIGGISNALLWHPTYAPVRKTARFRAFLRKAGMVEYWRARGWPDLCRPMGADDFVCD